MQTQTVFKAGNSEVVAIPNEIKKELNLKKGSKVVVQKIPDSEAFIVKKADQKVKNKSLSSDEFDKWLENVLGEDKKILDELAIR